MPVKCMGSMTMSMRTSFSPSQDRIAEAMELGEIDLNALYGEPMRAHNTSLKPYEMVMDAEMGCDGLIDSDRIAKFDTDFSPCNCKGKSWEDCPDIKIISVAQCLVRLSVTCYLDIGCYARVCESCGIAWVTKSKIAQSKKRGAPDFYGPAIDAWYRGECTVGELE